MNIFLYIIIFMIGTLFGSFFTLAVYRLPLGKDITHERSYCPNCNHKLNFFDLIPILSYVFLGGKCRYCKQKIRPRYLLLEVLSGIVFVLFAMSINLNLYTSTLSAVIYYIFGLLYITSLFIISGIDKENHKIQTSVLLFGFVIETMYIIYLYVIEKDPVIYRYVIYLCIVFLFELLNLFYLRKKLKEDYIIQILLLCMLLLTFTYEAVTILSITFTLLIVAIYLLIEKINMKMHKKQDDKNQIINSIPFGFYLCITNIITLIVTNFYIFK